MILNEFQLNNKQKELFELYYRFLVQENAKMNLTAITEKDEVYIKHFYDSLKLNDAFLFSQAKNLLDVGSGAGFPGIPLKILHPHLKLVIIEPTTKRIAFLQELISLLNLENVELLNGRAEDIIVNHREQFDVVTARAVASLPVLLELCLPYVRVNGMFLAMKGSSYQEEVQESANALRLLDSEILDLTYYQLPEGMGERAIIKIRKNRKNNMKYPRNYAAIKKKHL
ncbi:MAG: 16S rRNA (guanine(527)-N(7))-methyltransferase RsmG [Acholeplasmataceae bacterium]|jgi:16S rRNA (guanine527-N7)-methyltransferase|nr:16S rRNA (guanine(527)-N(7))-methyltransferase RsmG [Acholeplasmataceae bacterium]